MALKLAHFPGVKDLASFDFEAQPSVDPRQIRDLAAGRWIANGENLLLLGPPGVGKTHLAIALGREAILAGYAVQFVTATTLVASLAKAHGERRLDDRLSSLAKPRLLIRACPPAGEAGPGGRARLPAARARRRASVLPAGQPALREGRDADHLEPHHRRPPRPAGRVPFGNRIGRPAGGRWGAVFGDAVVATAILDRLLHHSHVITIRGDSYRLREKRRSGLLKATGEPSQTAITSA
jgi:hypothetical protein